MIPILSGYLVLERVEMDMGPALPINHARAWRLFGGLCEEKFGWTLRKHSNIDVSDAGGRYGRLYASWALARVF